jgi:lysophospholipase
LGIEKENELDHFWESGGFRFFKGKDELSIHYAHFDNGANSSVIVISPGRCESYLKYRENIFDLYQSGYSIFILDHRGQGLSERLLSNSYKGYVNNFDDYANDLHYFITTIVIPYSGGRLPFLLAHSMGCAISLRMFQLYPNVINKAALLSPMISIKTGVLPNLLAIYIITLAEKVNQLLSRRPWYFLAQTDYRAKPFKNNKLTHCEKRYEHFIKTYNNNHKVQLGGVTIHWLYEALNTEHKIFSDLNKVNTPLCIFQAGNDSIVENKKQNEFCKQLHNISPQLTTETPIVIQGALHELLFEIDDIRSETLTKVIHFFQIQHLNESKGHDV